MEICQTYVDTELMSHLPETDIVKTKAIQGSEREGKTFD